MTTPSTQRACVVLIGNELLSGKITDTNGPFAIAGLRALGVQLCALHIIPDQLDVIARTVLAASNEHDIVITSGGVGPTHDDVTMAAVAQAFGVGFMDHQGLRQRVKDFFGDQPSRVLEAWMSVARLPEGAELLWGQDEPWPVCRVRNVHILPGTPRFFERQFGVVAQGLEASPFHLRSIDLKTTEGHLAPLLTRAAVRFESVDIGSYPSINPHERRVRVTLESKDASQVEEAARFLLDGLEGSMILDDVEQ